MKAILFKYISVILIALLSLTTSCTLFGSKSKPIDKINGKVIKVKNGNTIVLDNGLTVHLLGIPANTQTENYLKTMVLNERVELTPDQKSSKPKTYKSSKDNVWAYVKLKKDGKVYPVNGDMIRQRICDVNTSFLGDSLKKFTEDDPLPPLMDYPALKAKMLPASFMIRAANDEGTWLGTGFYISPNGLALTNNHVFSGSETSGYVSMPNADGRIDGQRNRSIKKVLYTDPNLDYSILQINLDPGETVPYLEVAKQQAVVPEEIGVVGNPLGYDAMFNDGRVTQIFEEVGKIGVSANIAPGNSGGPICNMRGLVVGISQSVAVTQAGEAPKFGVDIMRVRRVLDSHSDIPTYGGK